ncbi:MAG TPA: hypothetical protein VFZ11_02635 [Gemmatimonadaceae bacterium]
MRIDSTAPRRTLAALLVAGLAAGGALQAQQPAAAGALAVGAPAPDFTLPGATRYGRLEAPVRLSDFRGETVVLAFFFKARTKG